MRSYQLTAIGAAILAASALTTGCSSRSDKSGGGSVSVSAHALTKAEIDHVRAQISGAGISNPYNVPMGKKNASDDWKALVNGIPAGPVTVSATAYKADNTVVFQGQIDTVINDGATANINITMYEFTKNMFANGAPVISAIQVSSATVDPSGTINVGVVATDPDGDALTYAWTSSCGGSFSNAAARNGTFTAPATPGNCILTVKVTDTKQASNTAATQIVVGHAAKGNANITATPDLVPTIAGIAVNVTNPAGQDAPFTAPNLAHLNVSAADANTPPGPLTYAWAFSGCAGAFDSTIGTAVAAPVFVLAGTTGTCTFTVTVTDVAGGFNTGTLTLPVQAAAGNSAVAPTILVYSQSGDQAYAGQKLYFYVNYALPAGDGWTVDWAASTGTGTASNDNAALTSSFEYTVPAGLTDGADLSFTFTLTDVTTTLSVNHVFHATAASDQCAGKADGTSCIGTNLCYAAYSCQAGVCVGSNEVNCAASQPVCQHGGICNPATGTCSYQPDANGTACDDNKACTGTSNAGDKCDGTMNGAAACVSGPVNCPATTDLCMQGGGCDTNGACIAVTPKSVTASCDDGLGCTGTAGAPDHCSGFDNTCVHGADNCSGSTNPCMLAGTCVMTGAGAGSCGGGTPQPGVSCDDNDLCTLTDTCDAAGACHGTPKFPAGWTCDPLTGDGTAPLCMAPQYGVSWGGTPTAQSVSLDMAGNTLVAGTMYALTAAPLPIGTLSVGAGAGANVYAAKMAPPASGVAPTTLWAKMWGDDKDQSGLGVASSSGNVAMIGNYYGDMGIAGLPANSGALQLDFMVGLNATTGNPDWAKKIDMGGLTSMNSIYSNPTLDYYYVCGAASIAVTDLSPSLTFGGTTGDKTKDVVVAKINAADGTVAWARQIGGAGTQVCTGVTADANNVYLTGTYQGTLDFACGSPSTCSLPTVGNVSRALLWVAKLNASDGSSVDAKTWGTLGSQAVNAITLDPQSNVVIGGNLTAAIAFPTAIQTNVSSTPQTTITPAGTDAFILKVSSSLSPMWINLYGDASVQSMKSVATDSAGNIFGAGLFNGTITATFQGETAATTLTASGADMFTVKVAGDGSMVCMAQYGVGGGDEADAIAVNRFATGAAKDKGVFTGKLAGTVPFSSALTLSSPSTAVGYAFAVGMNPNSR